MSRGNSTSQERIAPSVAWLVRLVTDVMGEREKPENRGIKRWQAACSSEAMRLVATAALLFVAACTAFDGVTVPDPETAGERAATGTSATDPVSADGHKTGTASSSGGSSGGGAAEPNANASAPSCASKHGGATCGPDGNGDCCAIAKQGDVSLNKYLITAGRMRAFITKTNGNVSAFVRGLPAGKWKPEWSDGLPTDRASADVALGPAGKKACEQGANTGHTYWTPPTTEDFSDYDQATLDEKALNCVPWGLAQALCAFDGGHLATVNDLRAAFTNNGKTKYPWGDDSANWNAPDPKSRLNIEFGFVTEAMPAKFRGSDGHPSEVSFFIAPPGRFPAGDNQSGIADAAGNLLEWVGDGPRQFVWKGDFENHGADAVALNGLNGKAIWMDKETVVPGLTTNNPWTWGNSQLAGNAGNASQKDGYYSIGARCAF